MILQPYELFWFDGLLSGATIPSAVVAVSFYEYNARHYFLLSLSGYDGSIIFTHYPLSSLQAIIF